MSERTQFADQWQSVVYVVIHRREWDWTDRGVDPKARLRSKDLRSITPAHPEGLRSAILYWHDYQQALPSRSHKIPVKNFDSAEELLGGNRIHERTILLKFLIIILRALRLDFRIKCLHLAMQFQTTFARGGGGGGNKITWRKTLKTIVPIRIRPRSRDSVPKFHGWYSQDECVQHLTVSK